MFKKAGLRLFQTIQYLLHVLGQLIQPIEIQQVVGGRKSLDGVDRDVGFRNLLHILRDRIQIVIADGL